MKQIVKRIITQQLAKKERAIRLLTPKSKIISLIEKLHPYRCERDLIRIGPNGDGGYLIPNDLKGIQACFSPGVDKISEFELWCVNNGMEIFLADKSVDKVNLNIPSDKYSFIKKYVGCSNNEDFITLDEWVNGNIQKQSSDLLLQMDIEGGEYDTLLNVSDSLMKRFRILVIEFHSLQKLWRPDFFHFAEMVFKKILQTHYCVHIHPNNCCGINSTVGIEIPRVAEFTFLRKDRIASLEYANKFPHELDFDNTARGHIALPKIWYGIS